MSLLPNLLPPPEDTIECSLLCELLRVCDLAIFRLPQEDWFDMIAWRKTTEWSLLSLLLIEWFLTLLKSERTRSLRTRDALRSSGVGP